MFSTSFMLICELDKVAFFDLLDVFGVRLKALQSSSVFTANHCLGCFGLPSKMLRTRHRCLLVQMVLEVGLVLAVFVAL